MKNVPVKTKLFIGRTFKVLLLRRGSDGKLLSVFCADTPLAYWPQALGFVLARLLGLWKPGPFVSGYVCLILLFFAATRLF